MKTKQVKFQPATVASIVAMLANRYDLPELLALRHETTKSEHQTDRTKWEGIVNVTPRGTASLTWSTLEVTVRMAHEADWDHVHVRVETHYTHPSGGSNGTTREFVAVTSTEHKFGEYTTLAYDLMDRKAWDQTWQLGYEMAKKRLAEKQA